MPFDKTISTKSWHPKIDKNEKKRKQQPKIKINLTLYNKQIISLVCLLLCVILNNSFIYFYYLFLSGK